jgi:copper transport protein
MRRAALGCAAAAVLGMLLVVAAASPAAAHAELLRTDPADGARLEQPPTEVSLVFSEPVSADLGGLQVVDADGTRADEGAVQVAGPEVTVGVRDDLPDGSYVVSYRVISADSHPIRGAFIFSVGDEGPDEALLAQTFDAGDDRSWEVAGAASRWLAYVGTFVAAGGLLFTVLVLPRGTIRRRLGTVITLGAVVGAVGILAALPVQAALATGQGAGSLFRDGVLRGVLAEGVGWSTVAGIVGLLVLVVARSWNRWVAVAGAALATGSFALSGHNRASDLPVVATISDLVHLWAAATWFGGLVLLVVALRSARLDPAEPVALDAGAAWNPAMQRAGPDDDPAVKRFDALDDPELARPPETVEELEHALDSRRDREMVARFSTVAAAALVVVAVAGLALSWLEVRSINALTSTSYGALLLAKVGVVALVVAFAAYNNRVLVPTVASGRKPRAIPRMRRVVLAEVGLLAVAVAITAVLVTTTPARVAGASGIVEEVVDLGEQGSVQIVVDPGTAGANTVHLYTLDALGRPAGIGEEVVLEAALPAAGVGPLERTPVAVTASHLQLDDDLFALAGTWEVTVRLRVDRFTEVTGTTEVPIAP